MNKEVLWNYYQELLKSQGFEGIPDLLVKYNNLERVGEELMGGQGNSSKTQITLQGVAKIAHAGGLYGYGDTGDALNRIREMTLPYWDKVTTTND